MLTEAVNETPLHWGAWLELSLLITDKDTVGSSFIIVMICKPTKGLFKAKQIPKINIKKQLRAHPPVIQTFLETLGGMDRTLIIITNNL